MGSFLDTAALTPHGFCLSWTPVLIALHVVSDALIAASYYSIPIALGVFLLRRRDVAFRWVFWAFALFILACGTTHLFDILVLWQPDYWAQGVLKVVTAGISVATALCLWPLLPQAVALPSPSELRETNARLTEQMDERDAAMRALRRETEDRLRAETMLRQAQKMEALGHLTGGVAHDFNNLLMVVQGNLENLGKHLAAEDPLRRYVDRATQGAARGATLVQHLLAFARRQNLFPAQLDLAERMAEAVELLRGAVGHAIVLDWRPEPDLWPVETDATQLETALLNLAVNARDAMPLGGRLEVAAENVRVTEPVSTVDGHVDPGEYVRIRVSDSGAGMSQEVRDSAFEPFFTTKPVGKGTGLGLSQVYGFVKQSRGHVGIDSAPGRGTTVTLWLPRAVPALGGSTRATAPASSPWPG